MACFEVRTWHAIHFLRSCRGPALAGLGHPDVASGRYSCAARSYGDTTSPVSMSPREGALTSHTESPQCPQLNVHSWRAACGTSPEYSFPASAHTLSKPSRLRLAPLPRSRTHYSTCPEKGRELVGERSVCSVATSGCPTRSEDGFPAGARNIPPRPVQPSPTTASNLKNKAP